MIGGIFSALMIAYGLVSVAVGAREDSSMVFIGIGVFMYSLVCLYVSTMGLRKCNLTRTIVTMGVVCNDFIVVCLCGVLFGNWWWYVSLTSSLIFCLTWCVVLSQHRVEDVMISRPRKTFLDID